VHWTANFDEIQDFENDIRNHFGGSGLMADADFHATEAPLGPPKAGRSDDLDDLAVYVKSLERAYPSPYREMDGELTPAAVRGEALFHGAAECGSCHNGADFTDGQRHDVGTLKPHSGSNGQEVLAGIGFKTPSLTGLWERRHLLHDGSVKSLDELLLNPLHGGASELNVADREDLIAFLIQIESSPVLVTGLQPQAYDLGTANLNERPYIDQEYIIEGLPSEYLGHVLVRTASSDKFAEGAQHVRFSLSAPSQVIVAYDDRALNVPPWLETWSEESGSYLEYGGGGLLRMYSRNFSAGPVVLGGNQPGGADSMYVLLVAPLALGVSADSDGDGVVDSLDNCMYVANAGTAGCDSDQDGYGNACDADFNQTFSIAGDDFNPIFLVDYANGTMSNFLGYPNGTDTTCDGVVDNADFDPVFLDQFYASSPGPSGLSCAGVTQPCP